MSQNNSADCSKSWKETIYAVPSMLHELQRHNHPWQWNIEYLNACVLGITSRNRFIFAEKSFNYIWRKQNPYSNLSCKTPQSGLKRKIIGSKSELLVKNTSQLTQLTNLDLLKKYLKRSDRIINLESIN
jgi:hypothetical protein